jgi:hypothetical protein
MASTCDFILQSSGGNRLPRSPHGLHTPSTWPAQEVAFNRHGKAPRGRGHPPMPGLGSGLGRRSSHCPAQSACSAKQYRHGAGCANGSAPDFASNVPA